MCQVYLNTVRKTGPDGMLQQHPTNSTLIILVNQNDTGIATNFFKIYFGLVWCPREGGGRFYLLKLLG